MLLLKDIIEGDKMETPIHPAELLKEIIGKDKILSREKASTIFKCSKTTIDEMSEMRN